MRVGGGEPLLLHAFDERMALLGQHGICNGLIDLQVLGVMAEGLQAAGVVVLAVGKAPTLHVSFGQVPKLEGFQTSCVADSSECDIASLQVGPVEGTALVHQSTSLPTSSPTEVRLLDHCYGLITTARASGLYSI